MIEKKGFINPETAGGEKMNVEKGFMPIPEGKTYVVLSGSESHRRTIRKLVKEAAGDVEKFKELVIARFKKFDDEMLVNQAEKSRMDATNSGPELLRIT
ncbi:MAG: hypothetical protein ACD_28C00276G0003 [uncultured bacterium]|nr:MAG: hypothetical protein ACD_28C00276G0003 [uncultured bacterium]KKU52720.1 MAG: hypothetical protein UX72_C0003G0101 [Parcubacteria group bacterium GW2011_GWA2_47_10]